MSTRGTATDEETQRGVGEAAERSLRSPELQDALNFYLFHPLAWRLARRLTHTPITPNVVSVTGGFFVVAAAVAYAQPGWPWPAVLGLLLHMTWHVVDGADGDLARLTGRSGPTGELVDGICDYASHVVLYVVLAYVLHMQIGPLAWALASVSGLSHMIQSNHFEVQRRQYQWWVYGVPWLRNAQNDGLVGKGGLAALGFLYLGAANRLAPQAPSIDAALADAEGDQVRLEHIRQVIRHRSLGLLSGIGVLSANHRTVTLGLSMLAGSPVYYFLYEAVVLNFVLVRSIKAHDAMAVRIAREINHLQEPCDRSPSSRVQNPAS